MSLHAETSSSDWSTLIAFFSNLHEVPLCLLISTLSAAPSVQLFETCMLLLLLYIYTQF